MRAFLESEIPKIPADKCLFHVIPAPYEETVSYGGGTAAGPAAILEASYQLEAYDGISCPCEDGIYTTQPVNILDEIQSVVQSVLNDGNIPVLLGGEHSVTNGVLRAFAERGEKVGIIQFDAHADLRDTYEGDPLSHACVMHRAVDLGFEVFQIGVRALSMEEVEFRKEKNIQYLDACEIGRNGIPENLLPEGFPEKVFITFDVDGLCPSIVPATGTPEPGGLTWWQTMECLEKIAAAREIVGFDVVELAPIAGHHASDFATARLTYNIMGYISRQKK